MRHSVVTQQSRSCVASALGNACVFPSEQYCTGRTKGLHPRPQHAENCLICQAGISRLNHSWLFHFSDFRDRHLYDLFTRHVSSSPAVTMFYAERSAVRLSGFNSSQYRFSAWFFTLYFCPLLKDSPRSAQRPLRCCGPEVTCTCNLSQAGSVVITTILFIFLAKLTRNDK